jgi:adenylate cyclase
LKLHSPPRILIVDESADSREVLGTLLARQGARVFEARRAEQAVQLAQRYQPDLIVVDRDCDRSIAGTATSDLESAALVKGTPIVVIGTVRQVRERPAPGQFVSKPYHYGHLIDKIEELLAAA